MKAPTTGQRLQRGSVGRGTLLNILAAFLPPVVLAILLAVGCSDSQATQQAALEEQQQHNEELQQKVDELEKQKQEDLQKQIDALKEQQHAQTQSEQPKIVI